MTQNLCSEWNRADQRETFAVCNLNQEVDEDGHNFALFETASKPESIEYMDFKAKDLGHPVKKVELDIINTKTGRSIGKYSKGERIIS